MSNDTKNQNGVETEELLIPSFGYELLRDFLLPDILGKDYSQLLYWSGKQVARKFPIESTEELPAFFHEAGWGQIEIVEEKKTELKFKLSGEIVTRRIELKKDASFQLEAGFLAEQIQRLKQKTAEAVEEERKRKTIYITVQWDK